MTIASSLPVYFSTIFFAGPHQPIAPPTVCVNQQEFTHDTAILQFWADDITAYYSGLPVVLTFGNPSTQRTFYGYVNHASRTNNALATATGLMDRNSVTVYCVGASWPMKQTNSTTYTNMTSSQIVQSIATQFNLSANIVPSSVVWPIKMMAGQSYWQFCVSLAQEIGYTFYCSGVQLVFKPRTTDPGNLTSLAAAYDYLLNAAIFPIFTPVVGATSPSGGQLVNRRYGSIDPRTLQIISSTVAGSPTSTTLGESPDIPIFDHIEHYTVQSQAEADLKTQGAGQLNQLYITATATALGNPMVGQGSLIYISNANGSQNGLWFVTSVEHQQNNVNYQMSLSLGRDSLGATTVLNVVPQTQNLPTAHLVNGSWVAGP